MHVSQLRDASAAMVVAAMADPCPHRTAYALTECDRLFERCRSPYEALLIPALAVWSAITGGNVRCREYLRRFGMVTFLVTHPQFRCPLVLECDRARRSVARDRKLEAAGYAVCRLAMTETRADITTELDAAFRNVSARYH